MRGYERLGASMLVVSLGSPGISGAAEFMKPRDERIQIGGGVFLQKFDTTIRVKEQGRGVFVNLEDDLGYDDDYATGWVAGYWRFASRHRIGVSYFSSNRDVTAVADKDIDVGGGEILPAGAGYESEFNVDVLPFQYSYSFMQRENFELSGSLGLHWYSVDYDIEGALGLGEEEFNQSVSVSADAPMPLIGLGFDYYISKRWHANVAAEAFALEIDDGYLNFKGSIVNLRLGTRYWIWNNLGVGASINWFSLNVEVADPSWNGDLEYSYYGPQAFVLARF